MFHKVDYIGYTQKIKPIDKTPHHSLWDYLYESVPEYILSAGFGQAEIAPKRRFYTVGVQYQNHTFIWIKAQGEILVEHTGAGCDALDSVDLLEQVIKTNASRLTRLDVATDILTKVRPDAFVDRRSGGKERSGEEKWSPDGRTCYIGSKTSNRWCKVYRYDQDHPRKDYLRIEYTYKSEDAKIIGQALKKASIEEIALISGKRYKWKHNCYKPENKPTLEQIKAYRPERGKGKTVGWLYSQVTASLVKLSSEGIINLEEFFDHVRKQSAGN